jgi:hypothetical protein
MSAWIMTDRLRALSLLLRVTKANNMTDEKKSPVLGVNSSSKTSATLAMFSCPLYFYLVIYIFIYFLDRNAFAQCRQ